MTKITAYTALTTALSDDVLPVVDIHDTTMAATGTTKKVTAAALTSAGAGFVSAADQGVSAGNLDNTAPLQAAVNLAQSNGLPLLLPAGMIVTGTVTVAAGVLAVRGPGRDNCTLKLKNGTNGYIFSFSPSTSVAADFRDFALHGNAENQSAGGCIYAAGAVQSHFDSMHFYDAYDVCLWLYQIGPGNLGHHNRVTRCLFDGLNTVAGANQQGIRMQSCDENYVAFNDFESWGGTSGTPGSEPYAIKDWSGIQQITGNVFVGGQEAIRIQDQSSTRIIGNTFDGQGRSGIHASGSKNVIMANLFSDGSSASTGAYGQCEIDNSTSAVVVGNSFTVTTASVVRNCIRELSSSSSKTVVSDNVIDLSGGSLFGGNKAVELFGAASAARGNPGFNPQGKITSPPGVATSGSAVTNSTGLDATVFVACGAGVSVSVVAIGGQATGLTVAASTTSSGVRLPAGQALTLTYSGGTPSWTWFGD